MCDEVEGRVLSKEPFAEWARDYVLYCHIVSNVKGEKRPRLLRDTKAHGFHSFMFLDSEGLVLSRHSGPLWIRYFEQAAQRAKRYVDLKARAARGDSDAAVDALIRSVELYHLKPGEARARLAKSGLPEKHRRLAGLLLDLHERALTPAAFRSAVDRLELPPARRAELAPRITDAEVDALLRLRNAPGGDPETATRKLLAMVRDGRQASTEKKRWSVWMILLQHAERRNDAALLEEAIEALAGYGEAYSNIPSVGQFLERKRKALRELKARSR